MSRLLQNIIILIAASVVLAYNETTSFRTSSSLESKKFSWTIERLRFISSTFPITSPVFNFCYTKETNETECAKWNALVRTSKAEQKYLDFELVMQDYQYWDSNTYIKVELANSNGKVIRTNYEWSNSYFIFSFLWDDGKNSLNNLYGDTLVIRWEMVKVNAEKDIITEEIKAED